MFENWLLKLKEYGPDLFLCSQCKKPAYFAHFSEMLILKKCIIFLKQHIAPAL